MPNFNVCDTTVGAGSGATLVKYWFVGIDYNGNKTLPFECDVTNQTLGTPTSTTMPLTGVVSSSTPFGLVNTYSSSGRINSSGYSYTISGFSNAGNNISCVPFYINTKTMKCYAPSGVTESASATAAINAFNRLGAHSSLGNSIPGLACADILKGTTGRSLVTCLSIMSDGLIPDDGSITTQAYTPPTRNGTGDATVAGTFRLTRAVLALFPRVRAALRAPSPRLPTPPQIPGAARSRGAVVITFLPIVTEPIGPSRVNDFYGL